MKAVLEDVRSGEVATYDVPAPELRPGGVLVRTAFSAVSAGTERAKLETGEMSLVGKAMARPDLVAQVLDFARKNGVKAAYQKVMARLDSLSTMGYSCSGHVTAVGAGVTDLKVGDRVACGGVGYANHCEMNFIPANLVVPVPDAVSLEAASLTTIGAIAMQGVRQANLALGETVAVVGAGLVGVLTVQLARAAGCRVVAIDMDPGRVARAREFGAELGLIATDSSVPTAVKAFSIHGADAAIVTAASRKADPLELAAKIVRDRGRIVVVGDVGMGVSRAPMYMKELSLFMSRSYGPGRYDPQYEEGGVDYPIGYVRWTERRNMESFLALIASGDIQVDALLAQRFSVEDAGRGYQEIRNSSSYTCILEYPTSQPAVSPAPAAIKTRSAAGQITVGCIGAGGFARDVIFPALRNDKYVVLSAVATASGATAETARRSFGFQRALNASDLVADPGLNAVFVVSHHQSHAEYIAAALRGGKAVFAEKPLAVNRDQLDRLRDIYDGELTAARQPFVMVGFNRRFAPMTSKLRRFFADRQEPMMLLARINAGYIPREHWTQQDEGGRIVGEICHFIDWARSIVGKPIRSVSAVGLPDAARYHQDNLAAVLTFTDGSAFNLIYTANGDSSIPKEYFEVSCQGGMARLEDFTRLELARAGKVEVIKAARNKGHAEELALTLEAIRNGKPAPISWDELVEVTASTFAIIGAMSSGQPVAIGPASVAHRVAEVQS